MGFCCLELSDLSTYPNDISADVEYVDAALRAIGMALYRLCSGLFYVGRDDGGDDAAFRHADDFGVCPCVPAAKQGGLQVDRPVYFGLFGNMVVIQHRVGIAAMANAWPDLVVADDGEPKFNIGSRYFVRGWLLPVYAD
jgi:hypothetical protein